MDHERKGSAASPQCQSPYMFLFLYVILSCKGNPKQGYLTNKKHITLPYSSLMFFTLFLCCPAQPHFKLQSGPPPPIPLPFLLFRCVCVLLSFHFRRLPIPTDHYLSFKVQDTVRTNKANITIIALI